MPRPHAAEIKINKREYIPAHYYAEYVFSPHSSHSIGTRHVHVGGASFSIVLFDVDSSRLVDACVALCASSLSTQLAAQHQQH